MSDKPYCWARVVNSKLDLRTGDLSDDEFDENYTYIPLYTTPQDQAALIAELEFQNKAFKDELFRRGSMDSCSKAAAMHGFVSPRQAGDDAREYIAEILRKAREQ